MLVVRHVIRGALVFDVARLQRNAEPVRKPFGNEQLPLVGRRELYGNPVKERQRAAPDVHCQVENAPPHELSALQLRMSQLVVQSPVPANERRGAIVPLKALPQSPGSAAIGM